MRSEVLQISANQIIQQILLILLRENIICSHVVKALVDFIDSQPNASNLYSNIRIKPFSFLVKMQQIYLLGALFYMLNSADSTNHLVGPKLKADITFQLNFHSIDETKLIDEISFLSLVVCVQKKTKPAHYEDILDKCTKMIKSTRLVSIFGWQLAALLAPFLNESNNEYILFFINKLFVDLQANQGIKHIYENFLARFFSSDGFHNIDLKIKDSILGQLLELPRNYIDSTLATEFLSFASFQSPVYKILEHKGATKNINFLLKVRKNFQNLEDYLFYKLIKHTLNILDTHFSAVFTTPDKSNEIFIVYAKYFTKVICIHGSVLNDADMNDCFNVFFDLCKEKSPTLCLICSVKIYNLNRISPKELKKIFKLFDQLLETITMDTLVIMVESLLILSPSIIRVEDISKGRSIFDKLYGFIFLYNLPEHIIHFLLLYCINLGYKSTMPFYPDVVSIVMKYIQSDIFNPKFAWLCFKIIRLLSQHIYTAAELSFFYQYALKLQYHCRNLIYSIHDWLDSKKKLTSESDEEWFTKSADKYSPITLSSSSFYDFLEKNETNSFIYGDIDSNNKENIEKDQDLVDLNEINDYLYNENPNLTEKIILDIADRLIKIFMSYPPLNSVNIKNITNFGIKTMILKYQMLLYALKKPDDHKRLLFSIVKYIIIYSTSKCIIKGFCDIIDKSVMCSSILLLDNSIFDNNLYDKFSPQLQLLLLENLKPEGEIEEKCRLKTLKYLRVHFKSFGYSNMSRLILSNCAVPANLGSLLDEILLGKGFEIENNETYHHLDSNTITFFKNINHLVKALNNGKQESTEQLNELEMFNFDYQKNYPNLSLMQNNGMREYIKRTFEPFLLNSDIYPKQVTSGVMKHFLQFINWNIEKNSDSITIKIILELLKDLNKGGKNCKDMVEFWLTTVALSQFMIEIVVKKPESLLTCFKDVLLSSENNKSLDEVNLNYLVDQFIKKHIDSMLKTLSIGISSSSNHVMQFLLRIIKVLLEYEDHIYLEVSHYLLKIDQAHWINVIPQLMICLKSKNKVIVTIITEIITNSAKDYPEPFVTALIATKSSNPMMAETIDCILYNIEIHDPFVVGFYSKFIEDISRIGNSKYKQAKLLLQDLHKTLGEKKQKTELMLHLNKLNKLLNSEFVTLNEQAFITKYRSNLEQILRQGASFLNNGNITLYNQEGSSQNHNNLGLSSIDKYLKNIESLIKKIVAYEAGRPYYNLYDCTKWLMNVDWSMMVMPGTKYWEPGMEKVFIKSIRPNAKVFMSKRRPCVVTFVGTDDKEYNYIIKYDEDLRQDERIMQFFDLINSFIKENEELYAHRFL
ncbi:MAG: phosphatidylinositol kinase-related protein kinase tor1 [Paramarteilia canceri]